MGPRQPYPWDIHQADPPNMHDINQGMCNAFKVPITVISNADIAICKNHWVGQWSHQVPHATCRELNEQGEVLKDIMQRIISPARFEDSMPSECKVICTWYEGTTRTTTYVMFDGEEDPRV